MDTILYEKKENDTLESDIIKKIEKLCKEKTIKQIIKEVQENEQENIQIENTSKLYFIEIDNSEKKSRDTEILIYNYIITFLNKNFKEKLENKEDKEKLEFIYKIFDLFLINWEIEEKIRLRIKKKVKEITQQNQKKIEDRRKRTKIIIDILR